MKCISLSTLLLLFIVQSSVAEQRWNQISIDPLNGVNVPECSSGNTSLSCKNLTYAFTQYRSWTQFLLYPGNHYITTGVQLFQNVISLSISTLQPVPATTTVFCSNNSGLSFFNVSQVCLANLHFVGCGATQPSTSLNYSSTDFTLSMQLAGIFINQCRDVNMTAVTVSDGAGSAGVIVYNTIGNVVIQHSVFMQNGYNGNSSAGYGGGGFVIEFSYCIPGDNFCFQQASSVFNNHNSMYIFFNCTFCNNVASGIAYSPENQYKYVHYAFGHGGGLSISFNGNASDNTIQIIECSFESNSAVSGGGLYTHFGDTAMNNRLNVDNCTFVRNKCPTLTSTSRTSGGGFQIEHYTYNGAFGGDFKNIIEFQNSFVSNNSAMNGGGMSASLSGAVGLSIINCSFSSNIAQNGAAIKVSAFTVSPSIAVTVNNSSFSRNSINYTNSAAYPVGIGTLYMNGVAIKFSGYLLVDHNIGTGIVLTATQADFSQCTALFESNEAINGGAMTLQGISFVIIGDKTIMNFSSNYASNFGGAIYNVYPGTIYTNCFIQYVNYFSDPVDWNSTFVFVNNTSGQRGNAIYSNSLFPCARSKGPLLNLSAAFCWNTKWSYQSSTCFDQISSDVSNILLSQPTVFTFPGQIFQLPLVFHDELNHTVPSISLLIASTSNGTVSTVNPEYSHLGGNFLVVSGQEDTDNVVQLTLSGEQVWHVSFPVHLNRCPPGMKLDNSALPKCICPALDAFQSSLYCDAQNFKTYLRNGFWLGLDKNANTLVVALCPPNFCYVNESGWSFVLPQNVSELDSVICGPQNRYGVVCGNCIEGYGPAVNSLRYECVPCNGSTFSANIAKYIFTVYIPLLVFFLIIFLFNIHLTTGPANGFIVFSQLVISTFALHGDYHIPLYTITPYSDRLLKSYQVAYGLFNLETFSSILDPFCLSKNMTTLNVLQLSYLVAVFPLAMVVTIIIIIKLRTYKCCVCCDVKSTRIGQMLYDKIQFSPLHAFAAFLLLSYNRLCLTSTYMVNVQPLKDEYGNVIGAPRPYYVQTLEGTSTQYILEYKLIGAFILLTVVLLPPILLLGYPVRWFENYIVARLSFLQKIYPADKVNIFLDVFQGCYRDHRRYFASLYFFFRLAVNVAYFMTDTWIDQYNIQVVLCAVVVLLLAVLRPYKTRLLNYVDIAIFTDMLILSLLSIYLYERAEYDPYSPLPTFPYVVQYILIFVPLLGMVIYILWYCVRYIKNKGLGHSKGVDLPSRDLIQSVDLGNVVTAEVDFQSSYAIEEDILSRANDGNTYVPYAPVGKKPVIPKGEASSEFVGTSVENKRTMHRSTESSSPQLGTVK